MPTSFEDKYRARVNANALLLLVAHIPACAILAFWEGSGVFSALCVSALLLIGPAAMFVTGKARLSTSISVAISSMGFSALIIHLGHGMIELHFHVFGVLAMLTVFGSVWPVLAAALTIALHHVAFWLWLPASVFNYKAGFDIVLLHVFFVIFETAPACFIAVQFGRMIRNQAITREQLQGAAVRVTEAAVIIAVESQQLATRASEQSATLQETSASSTEVSTSASQMALDTQTAVSVIDEADRRVIHANDVLQSLGSSIEEMSSSTAEIGKIIRIIDEIAFQTNILALNAAVEAARAGDAGQGFGVVADEVRRLAQHSANAAHDSAELINASVARARTSSERMAEICAAMSKVTESTLSIRKLVSGVCATGQEQSMGLMQIANALSRLEQLTQLTTASAEENATVGASLQTDARNLSAIVKTLGG